MDEDLQPLASTDRVFFDDRKEQYNPNATEAISSELL